MKLQIAIIAACAMVMGWVVASLVPFRTAKDPWDVATAISTVLAVVVALYFGLKSQISAELDAREKARLTASRAKAAIVRQKEVISKVHAILEVQGNGMEPDPIELAKALNYLQDVMPYFETETLLHLVPLAEGVAHRLARVQGQCESLHYDIQTKLPLWNVISSNERKERARIWSVSTRTAASDMHIAFTACANAFHDTPPTPSA